LWWWRGELGVLRQAGRIDVRAGDSLRLAAGVRYQFRAFVALKLIVATMPTWPGPDEAVETEGPW
jgi:mannose-6-phosphate isomerase-like protein (cupin superfamily)